MEQFEKLLKAQIPLLVDFYAEWCAPCKTMEPEVDKFTEKYKSNINVLKIEVEQYLDLALKYEIRGVPTFILFKDGNPIWKEPGVLSCTQLETRLEQYIQPKSY